MKTPRQILFKHYSPIDARLEQIQERAIASTLHTAPDPITTSNSNPLILICGTLWRELFQPLQRMWAVFAVAWVAIIAVNLSNSNDGMNPPLSRQESQAHFKIWQEQQRILAELNQTIEMPTFESPEPIAPPATPKPRSERQKPSGMA
jgi:hypothetical protein